jgi:hypothetical protein
MRSMEYLKAILKNGPKDVVTPGKEKSAVPQ